MKNVTHKAETCKNVSRMNFKRSVDHELIDIIHREESHEKLTSKIKDLT